MPVASSGKNGLMSVSQYKSTYMTVKSNKPALIKICNMSAACYLCSIETYGVGAFISISSNDVTVENIRVSKIGESVLTEHHYSIYRDSEGGVYVYSGASTGFNVSILRSSNIDSIVMEESDIDKESLIKII